MARGIICGLWLLMAGTAWAADDYGFSIKQAGLERRGNQLLLNADIEYRFSRAALEALANGVPLTLDVRLKLEKKRRLWWNKKLLDINLLYRIRYHALAKLYQVTSLGSGVQRNYASLQVALDNLGSIRGIPVMAADRIDAGNDYEAALAVSLDREALPLPLRSVSYLTMQWYLSSAWYRWPLEN